jgi:hypothetical protein
MMPLRPFAALWLAACFGSGPTPQPPARASVLYHVPEADPHDPCNTSKYIGAVTFTNDSGFVLPLPYQPTNIQGGCSGQPPQQSISTIMFPKSGGNPTGSPMTGGDAGSYAMGMARPALAQLNGMMVHLAYQENGAVALGPEHVTMTSDNTGLGSGPLSLALDDTQLYVAALQPNGGSLDPSEPLYPCCGGGNGGGSSGTIYAVALPLPSSGGSVTGKKLGGSQSSPLSLYCDEIDHCMTLTATGVAYIEHANPGIAGQIRMVAKDGTGTEIDLGDTGGNVPNGAVPVGLQADMTRVVSAFAMSPTNGTGPQGSVLPGCWIFLSDTTMRTTSLAFHSANLSCMDARLDPDDDHVYFTIIGNDPCENCGGGAPLHGLGIGRISLSDRADFESIALGVGGLGAGPRRLRVDTDWIFAIDPFMVARIAKGDLDGQHDFSP